MNELDPQTPNPTPESIIVANPHAKPKPPSRWLKRHRKAAIIIAVAVVVVAGAGALGWNLTHPKKPVAHATPTPKPSPTPVPTPVTKLSPLTGVAVDPALANRPITGVVIENQTDARPQSGLSQAGVVYEANAEGGITRFIAFFLDQRPPSLGPVRSLRTYFVDWALEFNSPVAHAGGNADALDLVSPLGMKDLNALSFAASGFYRTTDRFAPHNLYTSSDKLDQLLATHKFNGPATFTPSPRKPDTPVATPPHPNIHIDYSYAGYQVDYKYDPTTNDYARSLAGAPHVDRNTGKQIHVKNIVIEMMPTSNGTTRIGEQTVIMGTVGKGQGWVLRDGDAIPVTWSKDSHSARTKLLDASGNDVPLDAGNTWYSIVPVGKTVSF
ncbi:MAG TPA: DUF3048 domain-containing protein [Candidatus Saccharimonadia bacterium]|nr:DUF3048 domain-containing protein [Candidatus Saccharimonadia bacterium]